MDYFCGPLILYTSDKVRLTDFLSNVFEFDVDLEQGLVIGGGLNLKIEELKLENTQSSSSIAFSFQLKNEDALLEIVKKYNFFQYRNEAKDSKSENISIEKTSELSIFDLDGREWRFEALVNH